MANQYHNLGGWLRDVRNVLGDGGYPLADSYYWELRQLIQELLADLGDDVSDAEDLEPSDGDDDVEVLRSHRSGAASSDGSRAGARSEVAMGGAARVGQPLSRAVRPAKQSGVRSDTADVAGAAFGTKRLKTIEVPLPLNKPDVPRGTRASVRKRTPSGRSTPFAKNSKRGKVRR